MSEVDWGSKFTILNKMLNIYYSKLICWLGLSHSAGLNLSLITLNLINI